ncbi:staphylopine uptake ABC transporter ATP-binding protein CntD [Paenibacillus xanthanilyticus]|uniref:Staphylopine uptake ABC transporter ATP-binding protein CntD n=1 Tax=Paenibacillus xanthanilyticus TaxID=1783531 RepID=A0ABV8K0M1_9BACL
MNILEVNRLRIHDPAGDRVLVQDSSFRVKQGSCLAIVGESGSGKSLTCRAIMRLLPPGLRQSGEVVFRGENLGARSERGMSAMRGKRICLIPQNGMRAFDPSSPVGVHARETLRRHYGWGKSDVDARMAAAMESVMLPNAAALLGKYPHELSGGMLQRMMIALTIVLEPDLIIADEPTTALDMVTQFEVVQQLLALRERVGGSMLLISHDLGVVERLADEVAVMREGTIVEFGDARAMFSEARHPYTRQLVAARQALSGTFRRMMEGEMGC